MNVNKLAVGRILEKPPEPRPESEIMANWIFEKKKPLVSIVCHTFNHVEFIRDALNGFLMQETNFPFEIIINDDASNDGTIRIVNEYFERYPNIIVPIIHPDNQFSKGVRPLEMSLPHSKAEYVALCEGDDFWVDKDKIQKQYEYMSQNSSVALCFHDAYLTDQNRKIKGIGFLGCEVKKIDLIHIIENWVVSTQTMMFKKKPILDSFRDFKGIINGDWSIQLISGVCGEVVYLPNIYACYRKNNQSLSFKISENKANRAMKLIRLFLLFDVYSEFKYSEVIENKVVFYLKEYNDLVERERCAATYYLLRPKLFMMKLKKKVITFWCKI